MACELLYIWPVTTKREEISNMNFNDYKKYLSPALSKSTDLIMEKAQGMYITDVNGDTYLDFVQGIAVNAFGHSHPKIVQAAKDQIDKLTTASFNMVNYPTTLELARRLSDKLPGNINSIFFSNGGSEANDGAIKLAKAYTHRPAIISFKGSFHGRSIGATTVTASNSKYRKYYEPMMGSVYFTTYPSKDLCPKGYDEHQRAEYCLNELQQLFDYVVDPEMVAAILMEPVQGEGGYVVPPVEFVKGVRELCDKHGILLILDEIQSGYCRTGKMFASEHFGVVPDIMTMGKAIAGGFPMSAIASTEEIMSKWAPGMHGTTFGGHPVCAAAGLAVLDLIEEENILENVNNQGEYLKSRLNEMQKKYPIMGDVRGLGLMVAVSFHDPKDGSPSAKMLQEVAKYCLEHKMITLSCGVHGNGFRFATALNVTREELDKGLEIFEGAVAHAAELI